MKIRIRNKFRNFETTRICKNKKSIFDEIKIDGDSNCLYRSVSFYLLKKQDYHLHIRELVYKYIYNNKNDYLEYCYSDKGKDYLKIE